jgi:hypothetical protein
MYTPTTGSTLVSQCTLNPGYYFDAKAGAAALCPLGTWSSGLVAASQLLACEACPDGYTTLLTGAESASSCVIAAGHGWNGAAVVPCEQGSYSGGVVADTPVGDKATLACLACPSGTTTSKVSLATAASDCDVCIAGYGRFTTAANGAISECDNCACARCPANYYSNGDNDVCMPCDDGLSDSGSTGVDDCNSVWHPPPPPSPPSPPPSPPPPAPPPQVSWRDLFLSFDDVLTSPNTMSRMASSYAGFSWTTSWLLGTGQSSRYGGYPMNTGTTSGYVALFSRLANEPICADGAGKLFNLISGDFGSPMFANHLVTVIGHRNSGTVTKQFVAPNYGTTFQSFPGFTELNRVCFIPDVSRIGEASGFPDFYGGISVDSLTLQVA